MRGDLTAATITIPGANGDEIEAYYAAPSDGGPRGSVVVLHHLPGYDAATKEITRRFAAEGFAAICPNLYSREAPGADPDDAAATARALGGVPDERLVGDVAGAAAVLRAQPASNGAVGVIGYCSGGRQSVLAACNLDLQAAVDCYGAFVVADVPDGFPFAFTSLRPLLENLSCPLLGLFGAEDQFPSPEQNVEMAILLEGHGKSFTSHTFEGAGHAFFATDRPSYRPEVATKAWGIVLDFFTTHLAEA